MPEVSSTRSDDEMYGFQWHVLQLIPGQITRDFFYIIAYTKESCLNVPFQQYIDHTRSDILYRAIIECKVDNFLSSWEGTSEVITIEDP